MKQFEAVYRETCLLILVNINLAIAGDLHGAWTDQDNSLLKDLKPDAILFVGDLGDGDLRVIKRINKLTIPTAVILGNHDRGSDSYGEQLKKQLSLLGEKDCSWRLREWNSPPLSVVGGRPCSSGGGYFLTSEVRGVFGPVTLEESINRIVIAANQAPKKLPLILLAHSGPTGLGSEASSLCGRDWKKPQIDWGDKDLDIAIDQIRKKRKIDLVVFGHMHHKLKRVMGFRDTFYKDRFGTVFLNAAFVPRRLVDESGDILCHFSWVEFSNGELTHASHRWFRSDCSIAHQTILFKSEH